jgi:hypothetical protein
MEGFAVLAAIIMVVRTAKDIVEYPLTARDLYDVITHAAVREALRALGNVHAATGSRLLGESRQVKSAEGRRQKIASAVTVLEQAYDELSLSNRVRDRKAACDVALLAAECYALLGNDPWSVWLRAQDVETSYRRYLYAEGLLRESTPVGRIGLCLLPTYDCPHHPVVPDAEFSDDTFVEDPAFAAWFMEFRISQVPYDSPQDRRSVDWWNRRHQPVLDGLRERIAEALTIAGVGPEGPAA